MKPPAPIMQIVSWFIGFPSRSTLTVDDAIAKNEREKIARRSWNECFSGGEGEGVRLIREGGNLLTCFAFASLDEDCTRYE